VPEVQVVGAVRADEPTSLSQGQVHLPEQYKAPVLAQDPADITGPIIHGVNSSSPVLERGREPLFSRILSAWAPSAGMP
jgi:hypothetical protein